jgi:hypothetical protein
LVIQLCRTMLVLYAETHQAWNPISQEPFSVQDPFNNAEFSAPTPHAWQNE